MPSKMALVDYKKCHPEKCDSGICAAALVCSHGLLRQEAPFEIPMTDPFLCRGCGDCVESCPQQAIFLQSGLAQIDPSRCNRCSLCLDVCPQGAIIELTPVSRRELRAAVNGLKDKAEDIIARIERLKEKQRQS